MAKTYENFILETEENFYDTQGYDEDYSHIDNKLLSEKLVTFGPKAYPKFGHVVIMAGGAGCFVGETLVQTKDGHKRIDSIQEGELVLTFNEKTLALSWQLVLFVFKYEDHQEPLLELTINGEKILCTENHRFWVDGEWIKAKDLDVPKQYAGNVSETTPVYDIKVGINHNYFITESNIPVHNSGKGFIKTMLLGIEGKTFDVDELKQMMMKKTKYLHELEKTLKVFVKEGKLDKLPDVYDSRAAKTLFRNPTVVSAMHLTASRLKLPKRVQNAFFVDMVHKDPDRKPNIIFDVTLKNITKLHNLSNLLLGYDKKNIHLVWIVNDINVAMKQNLERSRVVPEDILVDTHKGAARTFSDIIKMGEDARKYFDGKIVVIPNKSGVDNIVKISPKGGMYMEKAEYVVIKEPGKPIDKKAITDQLRRKLKEYTPKDSLGI